MADSRISALTAASSVATNTVVPVVRNGAAVTEKATLAQIASAVVDSNAFLQDGTDPLPRPLLAKAREWVTPWDFGATGDGSTDDTDALRNAIGTGKAVHDPEGGTFKTTQALSITTSGQRIIGSGPGKTIIAPDGAFNALTLGGGATGGGFSSLTMSATNMTSGACFVVDNHNRVLINDIQILNPYDGFSITRNNVCDLENIWAIGVRGNHFIRWYGTSTSDRGILLRLKHVLASAATGETPIGFDWDGACASLVAHHLGLIGFDLSVWIRNAIGATQGPQIGRFHDLESDFSQDDAVRIDAGNGDIDFLGCYVQGSTIGSGYKIASGIPALGVRIIGGKSTGHARYAVETASTQIVGGLRTTSTLGEISGSTRFPAESFYLDPGAFFQIQSDSTILALDSDDYLSYSRSNNRLSTVIGGNVVQTADATRLDAQVPLRLPTYTVATLPDAATHARSLIWVSDESGGATVAFSRGTAWRRIYDNAVVS